MNDLPRSLTRFEAEFEHAVRRDLSSQRRLCRPAVRLSIAAVAAAAVALGVLSALPGTGPNVVARAAAAITGSPDSILHVVAVVRDTSGAGGSTQRMEVWQETSAPYALRGIRSGPGEPRLESLVVDGSTQVYDAATNTIYTNSSDTRAPASPPPSKTRPSSPAESADPYQAKILALLQSGEITVSGHAPVNGRDALKLVSTDGGTTVYVDPQTYRPIEFDTAGADGTDTTTFQTYEELPRSQANDALFSLTAQYPSARVDDSAADFAAAVARLSGKH